MPGPCSQPAGDKSRWDELNELVCNTHYVCWPGRDKDFTANFCEIITYREWLSRRNRLRTGKS